MKKLTMKKIIMTNLVLFAAFAANAQVSIGGKQSVEGTSTILDFNSTTTGKKATEPTADNTNGIILPSVQQQPVFTVISGVSSPNNGTFIYERATGQVKMFENNGWVELSETGSTTQITVNTSDEGTSDPGAIIGSETSDAKGVLVLESQDKAMILPRIANPHTMVKSPYPGMMCYDTVSKSLAVFNGSVWNYWK